ncbi:MAG TPA: carboxypeptidase regulatory-like domain-containing protein [Pyrinomonadaceae bacterium]|nr:carboxypeptidase regulatory-like domain-containing protein [Pyrinomonadaceae bacterium]
MRLRMLSMFAMLFVFCTGAVLAQTTSGSITGTVVDPQQAAVANATVTVTEEGKSFSLTATTDGEGRFVLPLVPPGTYTIVVEAAGFKKQERKGVMLFANDKLSLGNLSLAVGAVTETVTVTSEATPVQADSGERSFTIQSEVIRNTGVKTRSYINLATLAPGVVVTGAGDGNTENSSSLSVNGVRTNSNNVQIDGITSVDVGNNSQLSRIPLDSVGEFKLLTSTYQPEYGRSSGAQILAITDSGKKDFHGSVYFYRRHTGLNANTFDNNRNNRIRPISDQEDKGYRIGGPVYIPGVFNTDKKKLFFFWNQEWTPRTTPNSVRNVRVPTALERTGDFSQSRGANGALFNFIKDHTLGLPCSAANTTGCFRDGGVLGRIPASRLYAPGLKILALYPLPNYTPVGSENFNYREEIPSTTKERNDILRLDYNIDDNWRLSGRRLNNDTLGISPYNFLGFILFGNLGQFGIKQTLPRSSYAGTLTGILNPSTVVEFTYGFSKNIVDGRPNTDKYTRTATGLQDLPLVYPDAVVDDILTQFGFGGSNIGNAPSYQAGAAPQTYNSRTDDIAGSLSKIFGDHVTKFGVFYHWSTKLQTNRILKNGGISFSDSGNNPFDTNFGFANAATGIYNNYSQASSGTTGNYKYNNIEFYVQDNWKLTRRLTLDYGMRFSWLPPARDANLLASNFVVSAYNPANAPRLYFPVCIGGAATCSGGGPTAIRRAIDPALLAAGVVPTFANTLQDLNVGKIVPGSGDVANGLFLAGTGGVEEGLTKNQGIQFAPRLGFAFDVTGNHNLIIRGGFGIFYDRPQGNLIYDYNENPPNTIIANFDFGRLQDITSGVPGNLNPQSIRAIELDAKIPSTNSYNLGVQYKLPFDAVLDVAYVGSQSHHLPHYRSINSTPFGSAFLPQNQDPTRALNPTIPGSSALPANFYRPFKGFADIRLLEFVENSNYHSLQITGTRRFAKGLLVNGNYTWSRARGVTSSDEEGGVRIDGNRQIDYGRLGFDRTHNFNFNWVYELPKPTRNRYLGFITNGWQLSGIYRFQSGEPELVTCGIFGYGTINLTGSSSSNAARCVLIGDPKAVSVKDDFHVFNIAAFQAPSVGSMGLETNRDDLLINAPPINNWDMSLSKKFVFWENFRIEARLDAFNALNHTQGAFANFFGASFTAPGSSTLRPGNAADPITNRTGFGAVSGYRPNRTVQWMVRFEF